MDRRQVCRNVISLAVLLAFRRRPKMPRACRVCGSAESERLSTCFRVGFQVGTGGGDTLDLPTMDDANRLSSSDPPWLNRSKDSR